MLTHPHMDTRDNLCPHTAPLLALLLWLLASSASAQETRLGAEGFDPPPASLEQVDWLVGEWSGDGIGGAPAMENWTAPVGDTMVGTFIQQDGKGQVRFTELMYIREVEGSLELTLKHFNPDLTGWEEKDVVDRFRLVALEPCAAFFEGLTLRCADAANPGTGIVSAVRAGTGEDGSVNEFIFRSRPHGDVSRDLSYGCDGTTDAINECLVRVRDYAKGRERRYLEAAMFGERGMPKRVTDRERGLRSVQKAAKAYREAECGAVYEHWKLGTVRDAMALRCEIRMIDQRTHDIWQNWLTFQDATDPVLPEPGPTR